MVERDHVVSRRAVLTRAGLALTAFAVPSLVSACGSSGRDASQRPTDAPNTLTIPETIANDVLVHDLPPSPDGIVPGFLFGYPEDPPRTVESAPGSGGTVTAACQINTPMPATMDRNPVWQEINERLNVTLDINYTPGDAWQAKRQALLASGDLPDLISMSLDIPRLPDLCENLFMDLSEFIGGEKIKAYPNLALNSASSWNQVIFNGGIYGIPQSRPRYGGAPIRTRADILAELGVDPDISSGADLIQLMKEVTEPSENRWASAQPSVDQFAEMMGAPNGWREEDGRFTSMYETEEYEAALDVVAQLWKDGVYHPDSFAAGTFPQTFDSGQTVIEYGGFDPGTRYTVGSPGNPDYRVGFINVPKFDGGGTVAAWTARGFAGFTALRKDSEDKIAERLAVLNWIGAPTGTAEGTLTRYGIQGRNYDLVDGAVVKDPDHQAELLILGYLAGAPVTFTSTSPAMDDIYRDYQQSLVKQYESPVDNPAFGLYSETEFTDGASWITRIEDAQSEIIQGRKDIDDWRDLIAAWKSEVGDAIRDEYEAELAARA